MQSFKCIEDTDLKENDIIKHYCKKCDKDTLYKIIVINENITGKCAKCKSYATLKKNENYIPEEPQQNIPKCPICGSINIKKITITRRVMKTALFGTLGVVDDAGKTYQCNNCDSKF
mgnify:CR=1 FL=1